jgi:hypothetical protein
MDESRIAAAIDGGIEGEGRRKKEKKRESRSGRIIDETPRAIHGVDDRGSRDAK